jgi:glycosyltransferase involved in cell wall biosynthesis
MNLGVILPTINLWGGVKRFLELGNIFVDKGHRFTVVTPEGIPPGWFAFRGNVACIADLDAMQFDALFTTESQFVALLRSANTRLRIFYHVLQSEDLRPVIADSAVIVFVNSRNLYDFDRRVYRITPFLAAGGVNLKVYSPKPTRDLGNPITVLVYGRLRIKRKGTRFVVHACERLHKQGIAIKLLLFDTPLTESDRQRINSFRCACPFEFVVDHPIDRNNALFHRADVFVSAEKNAGWANTSAEAMAAGIPVIATRSGSRDFLFNNKTGMVVWRNSISIAWAIKRMIADQELRQRLTAEARQTIERFDWQVLADSILREIERELRNSW